MGLVSVKLVICLALLATISVVDSYRRRSGGRSRFQRFGYPSTPRPSNSQPNNDNGYNSQSRGLHTASDNHTSDRSSFLGLYIALCVLAGVIVILLAVIILVKLCKASTNKARRTTPMVTPVKPAAARTQKVRKAPITNRLSAARNQDPDIFTVTPVLPSYADITNNADANRPPPAYSVRTPNLETDYACSVASPPPPYAPEEPRNWESRGTSGRQNVQYSGMSSSVDFVLG